MKTAQLFRALPALALVPLFGTGCLFIAPPPDPDPGDITFLWSFDGEDDCTAARVDEIDVYINDSDGNAVRSHERLECTGGGLTITDIPVGSYDVVVEAYNNRGLLLYAGSDPVTVLSNELVDMGVIELGRAGDADKGDITFLWSFEDEVTCDGAGVDEVDVELVNDEGTTVLEVTEACFGGGLTIRDVEPDDYTLYLDAYDSDNTYLFAGSRELTVSAGTVTDLGDFVLEAVDVTPENGTLQFDVAYLYPADMPESDCAVAGVEEFDVVFVDENDEEIDFFTVPCDLDAIRIEHPLAPGSHRFFIDAFGLYNESFTRLYLTDFIDVTITSEMTNDLGQLELYRDSDGFADLRIEPTLPQGEDCASLGLGELSVTITRLSGGMNYVDYTGMLACTETFLEVDTFVPGSYQIDLAGTGTAGDYVATLTLDAPPGERTTASPMVVLDN